MDWDKLQDFVFGTDIVKQKEEMIRMLEEKLKTYEEIVAKTKEMIELLKKK